MVPTCKNVAPYSPTPLNVGTMVFVEFFISSFCTFYGVQAAHAKCH